MAEGRTIIEPVVKTTRIRGADGAVCGSELFGACLTIGFCFRSTFLALRPWSLLISSHDGSIFRNKIPIPRTVIRQRSGSFAAGLLSTDFECPKEPDAGFKT